MRKYLFLSFIFIASHISAQQVINEFVVMWTTGKQNLWDGKQVNFWGFSDGFASPVFPGPIIYMEEGDSMILKVRNQSQGAPHTVHLHGLDVDQANDGVPNLSFEIDHMEERYYRFLATHAGTYLYHCHVSSIVHVQMGMYGNLIVKAKGGVKQAYTGGPAFDKEYNWLMSELDESWRSNPPGHNPGDTAHATVFQVPAYEPDYFFVNGFSQQQIAKDANTPLKAAVGEQMYLRLSNVGYLLNEIVFPSALNAEIIDSDGRALPNNDIVDTIIVAPGERYGLMLKANAEFEDSVLVKYIDMNNGKEWGREWVSVNIEGFIGMEEREKDLFEIYPNPSDGTFYLKTTLANNDFYQLNDLLGRTFEEGFISSNQIFDFNEYPKGIYLLRISNENQSYTKKIIIQ